VKTAYNQFDQALHRSSEAVAAAEARHSAASAAVATLLGDIGTQLEHLFTACRGAAAAGRGRTDALPKSKALQVFFT
jgi:hypothetical protein